jgi:hypothetical protein
MRPALILSLLLFSNTLFSQVYSRSYEVKSGDKRVGEIHATKHASGEVVQYEVTSDVYMTLLFSIHVSYKVQANFKEGVMVSSSATVYINDRVQNDVNVERTGDHYTVEMDGHTTRIYEDIEFSSAKLYFSKPGKDVKHVFSETNGIMKNLAETADGKFRLKEPDNNSAVNTYTYSSEQGLHSIVIERSLFPTLDVRHVREPREAETKEKVE